MSGMTHQWHVKINNTWIIWKIFSTWIEVAVLKPAIYLHLLLSLKVHGALPPLCHVSLGVILNLSQKKLHFLSQSNIFTKSIYKVAIHIVSLHLLDQILGRKMYILIPQSYGGSIHQLKYSSRKLALLWFKALIVTSEYPVEHNSKRKVVVILYPRNMGCFMCIIVNTPH